ncbi:hypothetical protein GE09DRAFT_764691 [Coniochaeta sp. 2T2.1]|nr:hypothetical protein GE09DRAFT_764691 [Coniochaeta sp. 2T2.1]
MAGSQNTAGKPWTAELPFSPKKHKAFEDKFSSSSPVRFDHRLNEVLGRTPPRTPASPAAPARPRPVVIADSDEDDDDDSDDEFADLYTLLKGVPTKKPAAVAAATKKKESDLRLKKLLDEPSPEKKLAEFQSYIDEIKETNELHEIAKLADADRKPSASRIRSDKLGSRALFEKAVDVVKDEDDEDGDNSDKEQHRAKVKQALDRQASAGGVPSYHFFAPPEEGESPVPAAPSYIELGPWKGERNSYQFSLAIQSKLATKYLRKPGIDLPDELLEWILDVYPTERSETVRAEYLQILMHDSDAIRQQVSKLISKEKLQQWFIGIGADKNAVSFGKPGTYRRQGVAQGISRDWAPFERLMELLSECSHLMLLDTLVSTAHLLLRASMDDEVRLQPNLTTAISDALASLTGSCRAAEREIFCRKLCNLIIQAVDSVSLLCRALEVTRHISRKHLIISDLPSSQADNPFEDLRTRLQLSIFFKSGEHLTPERCGTAPLLLSSILRRLDDPDFKGGRAGGRGVPNYYDLDGYGLALTEILPFLHFLRQNLSDGKEIAEFNKSIDDLRRKISFVSSTIQITGPMDDLDAKSKAKTRWQALQDYRLPHFFPRPGGQGIFGLEPTEEETRKNKEALERKKSSGFLANFLQKARAANA